MGVIAALAKVPPVAWGTLALLTLIGLVYAAGGRDKAAEIAERDRKAYHETTSAIDAATGAGGDAGAARGRLRDALGPWPGDL